MSHAWIEIAALLVQSMAANPREMTWRERREAEDAAWYRERLRLNEEAMRAGNGWILASKSMLVLLIALVVLAYAR